MYAHTHTRTQPLSSLIFFVCLFVSFFRSFPFHIIRFHMIRFVIRYFDHFSSHGDLFSRWQLSCRCTQLRSQSRLVQGDTRKWQGGDGIRPGRLWKKEYGINNNTNTTSNTTNKRKPTTMPMWKEAVTKLVYGEDCNECYWETTFIIIGS